MSSFSMSTELTDDQITKVKHDFRRCREGTAEEIINLRRTGDTALIPEILRGIVWRYVRPEAREQVEKASLDTPLSALGMDSLMMLEVVLDVQDALDVTVEDAELRRVKTFKDISDLLMQRFTEIHKTA
jgi:3-hydroxyacyl-[acyl-carrier-protein] dehydratase